MTADKAISKYSRMFACALQEGDYGDADAMVESYRKRLTEMYASDDFRRHDVYPTMDVQLVYAVIAMCLELRQRGLSDDEIVAFSNLMFAKRRRVFDILIRGIDLLPNCYKIAEKWNVSDHEKRVTDGSIDYDTFDVDDGRIEYRISGCRYVDMFSHYGIRSLCKIFCLTDERSYANLSKHIEFVRHSDLSDGDSCHDEIIDRKRLGK